MPLSPNPSPARGEGRKPYRFMGTIRSHTSDWILSHGTGEGVNQKIAEASTSSYNLILFKN
jgi:hypothetical protein